MIKSLTPKKVFLLSFLLILQIFTFANAQDVDVKIKIATDMKAEVSGNFSANNRRINPRNLTFLDSYAGTIGLAKRFSNVVLTGKNGEIVEHKAFNPSEMVAETDIGGFRYDVDLTPPKNTTAAGHVSWLRPTGGIIMLGDVLPQSISSSASISIEIPNGWKAVSTDYIQSMEMTTPSTDEANKFDVKNIDDAVIYVGPQYRQRIVWWGRSRIVFNLDGEWRFNIDEGLSAARSIFSAYEKVFGSAPDGNFLISFNKFPNQVPFGQWEGDTRGRTINIVSSDMPFKTQSLQRIHEQLRHEMFHLWMPNGVNLSGNYDWFYEGFALYQSLKTGVEVNRLRFDDYLDTLSRAYNIDSTQTGKLSLIEASKNRWGGSNTQVYARGMLIAFLCDLAMLENSRGKTSVSDLLGEVYSKHRLPAKEVDGNTAVIEAMRGHSELRPIIERYIFGAEPLDWKLLLNAAGIEAGTNGIDTKLAVKAKPSGQQKDLLDKLGYNNWRKLN